jgi:erythromycin esterase-like protein
VPSIDRLLATAAEVFGEQLIAVILTGLGSDGADGARRVKEQGGTVVIQNPQTASHPEMPRSLAPTTVDVVAELDAIGPLLERIGDADVVLIGEASHGTEEFYRMRAELTKALVSRCGFTIVAAEADWPDAYRVNRWVRDASADADADAALSDFVRFPQWMWRNTVVVAFIEWLRRHNVSLDGAARTGFYGLDLYSLHASVSAVLEYLDRIDPAAASRARYRYSCFEDYGEEPQAYGYAAAFDLTKSCEDAVVSQLVELQRRAAEYATGDGRIAADDYFYAEQNARLVQNAEEYYRSMFGGRTDTWNLRDTHMQETLESLIAHIRQTTGSARTAVWAHNSHLGDARATHMRTIGQLSLGQLARERWDRRCCSVGFTTHTGTVTAASDWGEPSERKRIRPSLPGSYERLFHEVGLRSFLLRLDEPELRAVLQPSRLERAIGVIYRPDTERVSHYFTAQLADQFDAVIHVDETRALQPLERWSHDEGDLPETYPSAL